MITLEEFYGAFVFGFWTLRTYISTGNVKTFVKATLLRLKIPRQARYPVHSYSKQVFTRRKQLYSLQLLVFNKGLQLAKRFVSKTAHLLEVILTPRGLKNPEQTGSIFHKSKIFFFFNKLTNI